MRLRGSHSSPRYQLVSAYHWYCYPRRKSHSNSNHTGSKPYHSTASIGIRHPASSTIRCDLTAVLGIYEHARIHCASLLLVGLCAVNRAFAYASHGYDWFLKCRNCSWSTNHWYSQRSLEQDRYRRYSHTIVWAFLSWVLGTSHVLRAHSVLRPFMWSYHWGILDG
jgi:hypothetical protein